MQQKARNAAGRAAVRLDGEHSRSRILDAAEKLLAQRGFSGTSIAAISRESGLPASSIYWFFSSKQDLTLAVIERAADRWLSAFEAPEEGAADRLTPQAFFERALAQSDFGLPDFVRLQLLLSLERVDADPEMFARLRAVPDRARKMLAGSIVEARGGAQPDVDQVAALAMALAQGALITAHLDPDAIDLERLGEDLEVAVLAIARHRAGAAS